MPRKLRAAGVSAHWALVGCLGLAGIMLAPSWNAKAEPPSHSDAATSLTDAAKAAFAPLIAWANKAGGQIGVQVVDLEHRRVLFSHAANTPLNPASNQKLLTAAVALSELGPAYRFRTSIVGAIDRGGAQELGLRGHGDPSLTSADLNRLALALRARGLERVEGDIFVDQSRFDDQFVPPAFEQQPDEWAGFRAPVAPISVDDNTITLNVVPREAGQAANVWFEPPGIATQSGNVATKAVGAGQRVTWGLKPQGSSLAATVGGHIAQGIPRFQAVRRVDDPRLTAGRVLAHYLKRAGVSVKGSVKLGTGKSDTLITYVVSAPLSALLYPVGKDSNNFYAEMLLKSLDTQTKREDASSPRGADTALAWLKKIGGADTGTTIKNGSGLFDANRLSARGITKVLEHAAREPSMASEFLAHLAIGGVDGTLRHRFRDAAQRGRVRAKTGTLNDADALSGYVLRHGGDAPLAFAIVINGVKGAHADARNRIDAAVAELVLALDR